MKARVKETGEFVEITKIEDKLFIDNHYCPYEPYEPYEIEWEVNDNDYWTRLEHQYAGMAMQQLVHLVNIGYEYVYEETAIVALNFAHALVEKLKEKEEGK